jgi:Malectin domain
VRSLVTRGSLVAGATLIVLVGACVSPEAYHANGQDGDSPGVPIIPSTVGGVAGATAGQGASDLPTIGSDGGAGSVGAAGEAPQPSGAGGSSSISPPGAGNDGGAGSTSAAAGTPGIGPTDGGAREAKDSPDASGGTHGDEGGQANGGAGSGGIAGARDASTPEVNDGDTSDHPDADAPNAQPGDAEPGDAPSGETANGDGGTDAPVASLRINAGGPAVANFAEDSGFVGGAAKLHANTIDLSGAVDPAPEAVYETARVGQFTYTLGGFAPASSHLVRLHFAETYFSTAGQRICDISAGASILLRHFDIVASAGAMNKANVQEAMVSANADGAFVLGFSSVADQCLVCGIEIR